MFRTRNKFSLMEDTGPGPILVYQSSSRSIVFVTVVVIAVPETLLRRAFPA
jgi:hypothetical protein